MWVLFFLTALIVLCLAVHHNKPYTTFEGQCPFDAMWTGFTNLKVPEDYPKKLALAHDHFPYRISLQKQRIPRVIYQTHLKKVVPLEMQQAMKGIIDLNPEYHYKYFPNSTCREFIDQHLGKTFANAYDSLKPGAFKADLFRYCVLYVTGGVYLDSGFVAVTPLSQVIPEDCTLMTVTDQNQDRNDLYNAFICCTPRHPIIRATLELVLKRVRSKDKGPNPLYITGPIAFGDGFRKVMKTEPLEGEYSLEGGKIIIGRFDSRVNCVSGKVTVGDKLVFYTKYPTYRIDGKWYAPKTEDHYSIMWNQDRVFD